MTAEPIALPDWSSSITYRILDLDFLQDRHFKRIWTNWRLRVDTGKLEYVALVAPDKIAQLKFSELCPESVAEHDLNVLRELASCLQPGFHRVYLEQGRLCLTLICDDLKHALSQFALDSDWIFAQAIVIETERDTRLCNPFAKALARKCAVDARIYLTQTSAQFIATLEQEGIRRSVQGEFRYQPYRKPAQTSYQMVLDGAALKQRHAIVIGAGLAGSACAERLCARGYQVTLIDAGQDAASAASGNPAGMFMPLLAQDDNPAARWTRAAFLYAHQAWANLGGVGSAIDGAICGVLQPVRDAELAAFHAKHAAQMRYPSAYATYLDPAQASELAGTRILHGAWWYPRAGWLSPKSLCQTWLQACGARLVRKFGLAVHRLQFEGGTWTAFDAHDAKIATAPVVVLACGATATAFWQSRELPLEAIRGQISALPREFAPNLNKVICGAAYIIPGREELHWVGASYERSVALELHRDSQTDNFLRLRQMLPDWELEPQKIELAGRVGFRSVATDRLPLIGGLPDLETLGDAHCERLRDLPRHPGLYAVLGLASRGITWAGLAAETLVCEIEQDNLPIGIELQQALDPARFALKRARRHP